MAFRGINRFFEKYFRDFRKKNIYGNNNRINGVYLKSSVICHLCDEDKEDFRARTKHTLETPELPLPPIDPTGWVTERKYMQQAFEEKIEEFLTEREYSIQWLESLTDPEWGNAYQHPKFGKMTAKMFLCNWLAHDCLHIRQITRLKYDYLKFISDEPLDYAGEWI